MQVETLKNRPDRSPEEIPIVEYYRIFTELKSNQLDQNVARPICPLSVYYYDRIEPALRTL